jgi:hypothetical protein
MGASNRLSSCAGVTVEMSMFKSALPTRVLAAMVSLAGATGLAVAPISAQTNAKPQPELRKILSTPSPAESIEAPMAAKLADRLGQIWFESAEPACRASRSLDLASYQKLARTMLVAVGDNMRQLAAGAQDGPKADAEFATQAGKGAIAELRRLSTEPVVKEFLVRLRSRAAVEQMQTYLENIERALLLSRVEIKGRANPLASGDADLLQEIEKVTSAPSDYVDANKSKAMNRFLELLIVAERTAANTSNQEELLLWGPGKLTVVLEGPLKANCVMK